MRTESNLKNQILGTVDDNKIIIARLIVGMVFISEGLQKYMIITMWGPAFFEGIGFSYPMFWVYFTGAFEISCGILVLIGFLTRLASFPLIVIMITALITTKIPLLITKGFWTFSHEYSTDFALTLLLILLLIHGGGRWSVDLKILESRS